MAESHLTFLFTARLSPQLLPLPSLCVALSAAALSAVHYRELLLQDRAK